MKKKESEKPRYSMWQCCAWMAGFAWSRKEKKVLVLCLLQAVLAVFSNLVNLYLAPAILSAVERRASFGELLTVIFGFVGALMICSAASAYVNANALYGRVTVRTAILGEINRKCCTTSYPNLMEDRFSKLKSRARSCTQNNREPTEAVWNTLSKLLQNVAGFVIYMCLLATLDGRLMAAILVTALLGYFVNKRLAVYEYRNREEGGKLNGKIWYQLDMGGRQDIAKDIRIFGMKPWIDEITQKAITAYRAFRRRINNVQIWGGILDLVLTFLRNGLAYLILIRLVLAESMSVSAFLLYFSAVGGFSARVNGILEKMTTLYRQCLDLSSVMEFLEYPEPFRFEEGEHLELSPDQGHELKLDHVSYRYPGAKEDTLTDICLTIRPGEKIAVVGKNGAGKTTLVKLICGLFDPTKGRVLLDGRDIRVYNRREYYAQFAAVFQEFSLLAGTIAANVTQTEEGQDMSRIEECVKKAGLEEKISSLKDGYETYLNRRVYEDGTELSGGETQKLMLARALYKNAAFFILDEPTAALDPIAEADMYGKYDQMTKGRSAVYISHRLASTRFCDRILLLDGHRISEEGSHEELLELGGMYAGLFALQSRYYQEKSDEWHSGNEAGCYGTDLDVSGAHGQEGGAHEHR